MINETLLAQAGAVLLLAMTASPAAASPDPLARYRWQQRLVVAVAPDAASPALAEQRRLFRSFAAGARERDLVLVEAAGRGADAEAVRRRFGVPADAFRAILVGKDGGEKITSDTPLGADRLFPEIDSMPMRADEMRRRGR